MFRSHLSAHICSGSEGTAWMKSTAEGEGTGYLRCR